MILYGKKLAITRRDDPDNSNNDTTIVLDLINDGVDGSAVFGITNESSEKIISGGNTYIDSATPTLDVRVLKPSSVDVTQLESWASNQNDLHISMLTIDGVVHFSDWETSTSTCKIVVNEQLSDNDIFAFTVTKKTTIGFDPSTSLHQNGFFAGNNFLGGYDFLDSDGSNIADGWSSDFNTNSFASAQQTLESTSATVESFSRVIHAPFEGESFRFSINVVSLTGTYDSNRIVLVFRDNTDAGIGSSTIVNISSTGVKTSGDIVAPAGTVSIFCAYQADALSGTITSVVSQPVLRIDGRTTYTKF